MIPADDTDVLFPRKPAPQSLILDELHAGEKADTAHLPDQRMIGEYFADAFLKIRSDALLHALHQTIALEHLDILQCDRARNGMAGIGVAVHEFFVRFEDRLAHSRS